MEHPYDIPNKAKFHKYKLKRMVNKGDQFYKILREKKLFPFNNNYRSVRDMENYIENKLFTHLRQKLKRSNPKYQIGKLKLDSARRQRPVTSRHRPQIFKSNMEEIIAEYSKPNESKVKSAKGHTRGSNDVNRLTAPATGTQTPSSTTTGQMILIQKKKGNKRFHNRVKSAFGQPKPVNQKGNLHNYMTVDGASSPKMMGVTHVSAQSNKQVKPHHTRSNTTLLQNKRLSGSKNYYKSLRAYEL